MGEWMYRHGRSIYRCTQAPEEFTAPENCPLTYEPQKGRLYVHLFAWPFKHLHLTGRSFVEQVEYAQLLNDASEPTLTLSLPVGKPNVLVPVIELFLR